MDLSTKFYEVAPGIFTCTENGSQLDFYQKDQRFTVSRNLSLYPLRVHICHSSVNNPTVTFTEEGFYSVTLVVQGRKGNSFVVKNKKAEVHHLLDEEILKSVKKCGSRWEVTFDDRIDLSLDPKFVGHVITV